MTKKISERLEKILEEIGMAFMDTTPIEAIAVTTMDKSKEPNKKKKEKEQEDGSNREDK